MRKYKYILVLDQNDKWYVRRVVSTLHDIDTDTVRYTCDKPLGNDLTLLNAIKVLNRATGRKKRT